MLKNLMSMRLVWKNLCSGGMALYIIITTGRDGFYLDFI